MATPKAAPPKAPNQPDQPDQPDQPTTNDQSADDGAVTGDLMTVLRHLVENQQWGGNHGARAECDEAFTRLQDRMRK